MSLDITLHRLATRQGRPLLQALQLHVPAGVIHTVMGASGSGKSSLLGAVSGTLPEGLVFEGRISLQGRRIEHLPTEQRRVGLLFQDDLLFAHMTVRENLLFAVPAAQRADREAQVSAGLASLEMRDFADADPATLSGGQRTRVALLRALLARPQALLLDEPFAKLDAALRARMRQWVFALAREQGMPVLLVTHDAADVADAAHLTHLSTD